MRDRVTMTIIFKYTLWNKFASFAWAQQKLCLWKWKKCSLERFQMTLKCHGKPIWEWIAILSRMITFNFLVVYKGQHIQTWEILSFTWPTSPITFKKWENYFPNPFSERVGSGKILHGLYGDFPTDVWWNKIKQM